MPRDAYVVIASDEVESNEEAEASIPPELGVLLAWDKEACAGIVVTTEERAERAAALFQLWGWYASAHTSATSAFADVMRFQSQQIP